MSEPSMTSDDDSLLRMMSAVLDQPEPGDEEMRRTLHEPAAMRLDEDAVQRILKRSQVPMEPRPFRRAEPVAATRSTDGARRFTAPVALLASMAVLCLAVVFYPERTRTQSRDRRADRDVKLAERESLRRMAKQLARAVPVRLTAKPLPESGPLVPRNEYSGGALVTVDPNGQSSKLSLRTYHIDVHVEDGFARTTIDQTFFNHTWQRLEGTFHFPLPTDASLSRLAMYVNGKLMEGGMAERQHARNTFEEIKRKMLDPALLEWVDGSTFKMRVFPLEPRQEKRIVLSYVQRLAPSDGQMTYRFPAGHTMDVVGEWSAAIRILGGAGLDWHSDSHTLVADASADGDLTLTASLKNATFNRDLVCRITEPQWDSESRLSTVTSDGQRYLMLRHRPTLALDAQAVDRHWTILFEHSADRTPLLARAQIEVVRTVLQNAGANDTFSLVTGSSRATHFDVQPLACSPAEVDRAVKHLESVHLIGALDLAAAMRMAVSGDLIVDQKGNRKTVLLHVGSGMPALGERDATKLAALIPAEVEYLGIGVGRRWNQSMMKQAASRTGGLSAQINPDEDIAQRAFELASRIRVPRLIGAKVAVGSEGGVAFLAMDDVINRGEELAAICRVPESQPLPEQLMITATLDGQPWQATIPVKDVRENATYLPRQWASLEINRLLAADAEENRNAIIELSKAMYVMSPFTSLLVLENEEMYTQFGVDRGRKDHWALYPCPDQIEVVVDNTQPPEIEVPGAPEPQTIEQLLATVVRLPDAPLYGSPQAVMLGDGTVRYLVPKFQNHWYFSEQGQANALGRYYFRSTGDDFGSLPMTWESFDELDMRQLQSQPNFNSLFMDDAGVEPPMDMYFGATRLGRITDRDGELPELLSFSGTVAGDDVVRFDVGLSDVDAMDTRSFTWGKSRAISDELTLDRLSDESLFVEESRLEVLQQEPKLRAMLLSDLKDLSAPNDLYVIVDSAEGLAKERFRQRGATSALGTGSVGFVLESEAVQDLGLILDGVQQVDPFVLSDLDMSDALGGRVSFVQGQSEFERPVRLLLSEGSRGLAADYDMFIRFKSRAVDVPGMADARSGGHRWAGTTVVTTEVGAIVLPTAHAVPGRGLAFNPRQLCDLMAMAPGLNTTRADIAAVVDAELPTADAVAKGTVDPAAQALVDRCRAAGWQTMTLAGHDGQPDLVIKADGTGRHVIERIVGEGLREQVVCNGQTLWHIYREIGLAASRSFSRHHHHELTRLLPWLLPTADELSRGADVTLVDAKTVAVTPRTTDQSDRKDQTDLVLHLIFNDAGQLTARKYVDHKSGEAVLTIEFAADGPVRWLNSKGEEVGRVAWRREATADTIVVPDLAGLVTLPMPVRTIESLLKPEAVAENSGAEDSMLSEADALSLVLAYSANGDSRRVIEIIRQRFLDKGDRRDGFYVLLSRFPHQLVEAATVTEPSTPGSSSPGFDLRPNVEESRLKQYLRQSIDWIRDGDDSMEFTVTAPGGAFLDRLAAIRNLSVRWSTGRATQNRTAAQVAQEIEASLGVVVQCRSPRLGWMLMTMIRQQLTEPAHLQSWAAAAAKFDEDSAASLFVRQDRAEAMVKAGQLEDGRRLFKEWLMDVIDRGLVPPITTELYQQLITGSGQAQMDDLLLQCGRTLLSNHRLHATQMLATQMRELGNKTVADQLVTLLLAELKPSEHPGVTLLAVEQLRRLDDRRAASLMDEVMEQPLLSELPSIWRFAAEVAESAGQKRLALERLERAIELEFLSRPTVVNIETVRGDYRGLLEKYEQLISATETLELPPLAELGERIIRVTDQWRLLDDDDTAACQFASRLLDRIGLKDLSWDYLVSPLAENSGESAPWIELARATGGEQRVDVADMAWSRAFEFESTNPEILLEHARLLKTAGRTVRARTLLNQVVAGTWQPRFASAVEQARAELQSL